MLWSISVMCKFNSATVSTEIMQILLLCSQPSQSPTCFWGSCNDRRVQISKVLVLLPSVIFRVPEKVT